jgi:hypothetical protein
VTTYIFSITLPEEPPMREQAPLDNAGFFIIDVFDPDTPWQLQKEIADEKELAEVEKFLKDYAADYEGTYDGYEVAED